MMDDKVPNQIRTSLDADTICRSETCTLNHVQFTRTDHVISTIRELGKRMHMTNDLVDAITDAITKGR